MSAPSCVGISADWNTRALYNLPIANLMFHAQSPTRQPGWKRGRPTRVTSPKPVRSTCDRVFQ